MLSGGVGRGLDLAQVGAGGGTFLKEGSNWRGGGSYGVGLWLARRRRARSAICCNGIGARRHDNLIRPAFP